MKRVFLRQALVVVSALAGLLVFPAAHAEDEAPDALIKRLSVDVLDAIKSDKAIRTGDTARVVELVDTRIMPNVNFQRMTASAVGPAWRQATPEQKARLQDEFKILLVRTYAGAFKMANEKELKMLPMRAAATGTDVLVQSQLTGGAEPIPMDYRLEKTPGQGLGWKAYNIAISGVWMIQSYKQQFAQEINSKGIDGLIASLVAQNKANAAK